jgi:hypothetical protein
MAYPPLVQSFVSVTRHGRPPATYTVHIFEAPEPVVRVLKGLATANFAIDFESLPNRAEAL